MWWPYSLDSVVAKGSPCSSIGPKQNSAIVELTDTAGCFYLVICCWNELQ